MSCDTALIRIERPAPEVFAFMADPAQMSLWSFGTWRTQIEADGLVRGTSIKDGAPICVRIEAHAAQLLIDYYVGAAPETLSPRIFARITPAEVFGDGGGCGLSMTVFRTSGMDDDRWDRLTATHLVELDIIRSALETDYDHRTS